MAQKVSELLGLQESMNNLATIAAIDLENPPPLGIIKKVRFVTEEEELELEIAWLSGEGSEVILSLLEATYRTVRHHLAALAQDPEANREAISALMALVGESAHKMDRYLADRLGKPLSEKVEERAEFRALQQFYADHLLGKFKEAAVVEVPEGNIKNLEEVQRDREYELFYIRNEEGKPYFTPELLRNVKLSAEFEAGGESFEEDPLLAVRAMEDRDFHASAGQILGACYPAIEDFYKLAKNLAENELAQCLSRSILALFLTANPRNLLQNTVGKSCFQYFLDFHDFLRQALETSEYQKWIAYPPEERETTILLYLAHLLCNHLFLRKGGVKKEVMGLIHRTMRRGEKVAPQKRGETIWNQFLFDDEKFRSLLAQFPNGPLFKILDLVREGEEIVPFDPIRQENFPFVLYTIDQVGKKIDVLHLPAPIRQSFINKAEVVPEFRGFLRSLSENKKHLLVHLQDRTSWREFARSRVLEMLQKNAEFSSHIFVLTLSKDTDFYHQSNEYLSMNQAEDFLAAFQAQFTSPEECGFSLPWKELSSFATEALPLIHELFFHGKSNLTRRNREDFIEIFYQFLILKAIELCEPDSLSFTCKDGVDTGAAQSALFYSAVKLLTGDLSSKEELDFLRWLFYAPALLVRERAIDPERFHRALSALERFDAELSERQLPILKALSALYRPQTLKALKAHL